MKRFKQISVLIFYCLVILTILYVALFKSNDVFSLRDNKIASNTIDHYECTEVEDKSAPANLKQIYTFDFHNLKDNNYTLAFYTIHQYAEVYIGDDLVYSLKPGENEYMGRTTSCTWVKVPIYYSDNGKECKIVITPVYNQVTSNTIKIYLDKEGNIYSAVLLNSLPFLIIGVIFIVIGLIYVFMFFYYVPKKHKDRSLLFMGLISATLGLWKISDIKLMPLLFPNLDLVFSFTALLMLLILPFTWMNFIKTQGYYNNYRIINITSNIDGVISLVLLLLQIFNILDLRQTLLISQLMLIVNIVLLATVAIIFSIKNKDNKLVHISTACYVLCFLGILIDIIFYYIMRDSLLSIFSFISYIIYIVTMGIMSAYSIRQVAYTDIQTGLYNRSRCHQMLDDVKVEKDTCILLFDINSLKYINDKYGHAGGDKIIVAFANIVRTHIPHNSFAGRYGGDEFMVIFEEMNENQIKAILEDIKYGVLFFNENNEMQISYSCGFAFADKNEKSTLYELFKIADEKLYKDKEIYRANNKNLD